MKKVHILILVLAIFLMAVPASAAKPERMGEQIRVLFPNLDEYPAGVPFHITHGWLNLSLKDIQPGQLDFELYVDGEFVDQDFMERNVTQTNDGPVLTASWVHNFPDGLEAGTYIFEGHWYLPCGYAVDSGLWLEACEKENKPVDVFQASHSVLLSAP